MVIFNTDLDNTLIYSYRRDIGEEKICAEIYGGREVSFITPKTAELLARVNESAVLVPTTTRTVEQYERIDLGIGTPRYALACNGGVLLVDGSEDERWYSDSLESVRDCGSELALAVKLLEEDKYRTFEVRFIRGLFVFTKSSEPEISIEKLRAALDMNKMDVFSNGVKVYAVPKALSKGNAVKRFKAMLGADLVVAAGDSEFDISMLNAADVAIAPADFPQKERLLGKTLIMQGKGVFSEFVLENVLSISKR
ncbi:MAG: HAD hydrolase family protein [Clostridia bacterium]|nr:HAD hydrolase family protein [Clostridia bacterium]